LTARGGRTSHAAVVARGMGTCAVVGAEELDVDYQARTVRVGEHTLTEGEIIAIDGTTGEVFAGEVDVVDSATSVYIAEGLEAALEVAANDDIAELVTSVDRLLTHADATRRMAVRANADTGQDAARARERGSQGIGLCRTEHQFLGERRTYVEALVLASTPEEENAALEALLPLQRDAFVELLDAMDGLPEIGRASCRERVEIGAVGGETEERGVRVQRT